MATTTDRCGEVYMCFDWCDYDLAGLIDSGYTFTLLQVKSLVYQLLLGLDHLHTQCGFLHRDLKCR
jgi:serine/threonine protein kinase